MIIIYVCTILITIMLIGHFALKNWRYNKMLGKKKKVPEDIKTDTIDTSGKKEELPQRIGYNPADFNMSAYQSEVCNLLLGLNQRLDYLIKLVENEQQQ